jgi:nitrite reductase/ring-hydroxylating ferredoxin subunit/uncharacterized membrane protein
MSVEGVTERIESSGALAKVGETAGTAFSKVVRPGRLKDALSGTWMAHPLHPLLTDVTIGAWASAMVLDLVGGEEAARASDTLVAAGFLSVLPTAVTGLSDLSDVVNEEDRSVGALHALSNSVAASLYGLSLLARRKGNRKAGVRLGFLGGAAMAIGGFLGGHLAYRLGIGVDQTTFDDPLEDWTEVLDEAALAEKEPRRVRAGRTDILLYRSNGAIYALANRCSHRGGPLHEGTFQDGQVRCPWHLSTFDLEDGSVCQGPATACQPSYEVRVLGGKISVRASG